MNKGIHYGKLDTGDVSVLFTLRDSFDDIELSRESVEIILKESSRVVEDSHIPWLQFPYLY